MDLPDVVSQDEWESAQQQLRVKEKEATRARVPLRRRTPTPAAASHQKDYVLQGPNGPQAFPDLF